MSRTAFVDDVAFWVTQLGAAPAILVGHSLGGHTAFLAASRYSDLVRAAVIAEADPESHPNVADQVRAWLDTWPKPFASREAALRFFGGDTLRGRAWTDGLKARDGGLWPAFEVPFLVAALQEIATRSYWQEWTTMRCPTLIVRAERGVQRDIAMRMLDTVPHAQLVDIPDSSHDVHLDQPERWRDTLQMFLSRIA